MFKNNPNGTMLCIEPLMIGIENDIKRYKEMAHTGLAKGLSFEDIENVYIYLSHLVNMKDRLKALDDVSAKAFEVYKKYYAEVNQK